MQVLFIAAIIAAPSGAIIAAMVLAEILRNARVARLRRII